MGLHLWMLPRSRLRLSLALWKMSRIGLPDLPQTLSVSGCRADKIPEYLDRARVRLTPSRSSLGVFRSHPHGFGPLSGKIEDPMRKARPKTGAGPKSTSLRAQSSHSPELRIPGAKCFHPARTLTPGCGQTLVNRNQSHSLKPEPKNPL